MLQSVGIGTLEVGGLQYTMIVLILIALAAWFIVHFLKKSSKRVEEAEQKELEAEQRKFQEEQMKQEKENQGPGNRETDKTNKTSES